MSENRNCDLPLEQVLEALTKTTNLSAFPSQDNYFLKYCEIVGQLRRQVYPKVDAGLAALSNVSGLYTHHGAEHYDQVVLYASKMLNVRDDNVDETHKKIQANQWVLKPYELYLLLLSIRFHDVGNIYGREDHELNIGKVIKKYQICHLSNNQLEARKVCEIAGAHGGKTKSGSKDTIGNLSDDGNSDGHVHDIGFKKVASITRFADEICENRARNHRLDEDEIPVHNLIFHVYAYSIVSNYIRDKILFLKIEMPQSHLSRQYKVYEPDRENGGFKLVSADMPSVVSKRLQKAELERQYCNRFLPEDIQVKEINVTIDIVEDELEEHSFTPAKIDTKKFTLKEVDYPSSNSTSIEADIKTFLVKQCSRELQ